MGKRNTPRVDELMDLVQKDIGLGMTVKGACRKHGLAHQTYYFRKRQTGLSKYLDIPRKPPKTTQSTDQINISLGRNELVTLLKMLLNS